MKFMHKLTALLFLISFTVIAAVTDVSNEKKSVTVTIVYDNYVYQKGMQADWGFACVIKGPEKTILFDTGTRAELFMKNLETLKIDPKNIDMVVISHEHGDHTGGLSAFLQKNPDVPVFVPASISDYLTNQIQSAGATVRKVKDPLKLCDGVVLSGELGDQIKEQSLAIDTDKGLVIICGCSHPGIIHIVEHFKETLNRDVYLAIGGFHLMRKTDKEMGSIIHRMKELGVKKCGATHCTGEAQIDLFKKAFGKNYVTMGVGRVIEL